VAGVLGHRQPRGGRPGVQQPLCHKAGRVMVVAGQGLDSSQGCRDQRGWVASGLRRPRLPAVTAPGRSADRPGGLGAAGPPGATAGKAAALVGCSAPWPHWTSARWAGGRDGPTAGRHPGCQADPDPPGWPRSRPPGSFALWATPAAGASGPSCGGRPGWTRPAASPAPPTNAMASVGRGRPGGGGRSWTWPPASAASPDASTTATRPGSMPQAPQVALAAVGNQVGRTCFA
jgi:hypothetical protein